MDLMRFHDRSRRPGVAFVAASLLFLARSTAYELPGAELAIQTVDGLKRPISGVEVTVFCVDRDSGKETASLKFMSGDNGVVSADFPQGLQPISVSVAKAGYESYFSGFRSRYILRRVFSPAELLRIVGLQGQEQRRELRELLSGDLSGENGEFLRLVFYYEARLRAALRTLLADPDITVFVREVLATIGHSDDLRAIVRLPPPPQSDSFSERWRYSVATALVDPDDEREWSFLRRCALAEFDDGWVDAGAIQTLKLIGSARARKVLEEARASNERRSAQIAGALKYIDSNPEPLNNKDLSALVKRVASVIGIGTWTGSDSPHLNEGGDKALVDIHFQTARDHLIYTATFHRAKDEWALRAVRETYQGFSPAPPPVRPNK